MDSVNAVAFSHDGSLLASASDDQTVRLWNPTTGQEVQKLERHINTVNAVAFSQDGSLLASASDDWTIRLWNPTMGQEIKRLEGIPDVKTICPTHHDMTWSTNQGILNMNEGSLSAQPSQLGTDHSLILTHDWIRRGTRKLLWLPQEYRSDITLFRDNTFVIGRRSGQVTFIGLDGSWELDDSWSMGILYEDQGKHAEAEKTYQRALDGYEKVWGPDYTSTLDTFSNLGNLYTSQGKHAEAEKMYRRVLVGYEKAWDPEHTSTLRIVNNLGGLYADQGKLVEAEEMYYRALHGKDKTLGPEHTSTLDTINNLGALYASQGKLVDAEHMYQRALVGYEKAWGHEHTLTLDTVNILGKFYADQGKLVEAEDAYQRALKGYEATFGIHDKRTQEVLNAFLSLGNVPHKTLGLRSDQDAAADFDEVEDGFLSKQHAEAIDDKVQSFPKLVDESIRREVRSSQASIILVLDSDLPDFIQQECSPGRSLGSLVVLTTDGNHTQATTCQEYLSWRWPSLSSLFMETLEKLVLDREGTTSGK